MPDQLYNIPVDGAPSRGARAGKVTIVEFGDFQCPYCQQAERTLDAILKAYPTQVRIVFRHYTVHPAARLETIAALAAGEQGKFWPMHDELFVDLKRARTRDEILSMAAGLGLEMKQFETDLDSARLGAAADADDALALKIGVQGTPTFFINGHVVVGALPIETFQRIIDDELPKADALLAHGVKLGQVYAELVKGGATQGEVVAAAPPARPALDPKMRYPVPVGASPIRGPSAAKVTIVEFGDFECPYCKSVSETMAQLEKLYGEKVRVVWKHYPSGRIHPHARLAARAAIAAGAQGKFWEMHDLLFLHQEALERKDLEEYAEVIGLDVARFKKDLDAHGGDATILAESRLAAQIGVDGIPTAFVNGRPVVGAAPVDAFKKVIDEELAHADEVLGQGVKLEQLYDKIVPPPVPPSTPARKKP